MSDPVSDLAALFDDGPEYTGPTTDEMDGIFTEEDRAEKYNAYAQCVDCFKWTYIIGSEASHGSISSAGTCEHCGGHRFDPHSVTSKRSFNIEAAKRRLPKGIKKGV